MARTSMMSYTEMVASISENTEVDQADVKLVLRDLAELVAYEISEGRRVSVQGVCILRPVFKAAKPQRKGINPFTGEEQVFKAQPGKVSVKATPQTSVKNAAPTARSAVGRALGAEQAAATKKRERAAKQRAKENGTATTSRARAKVGVRAFSR